MPWASSLVLCPWCYKCQNAQQNCLVQPHVLRVIWKCECARVCECMHACVSVSCGCYNKTGVLHHITQNFSSMNSRSALHLHVALTWLRLGELFWLLIGRESWPINPSIAYVTSTVLVNACWEERQQQQQCQAERLCLESLYSPTLHTRSLADSWKYITWSVLH